MKNQKTAFLAAALLLMAGSAGLLVHLRAHPRLGKPGIRAAPIPGSVLMKLELPERVLQFTSTNVPEPALVSKTLPKDSSYLSRDYWSADGFSISATVILMGTDRTSIHNANYCLRGDGLDPYEKKIVNIPIGGRQPYSLPVSEWKLRGVFQQPDGTKVEAGGVYVFWFTADGEETPSHFSMMERLALHAISRGILQRWAYIIYFAPCKPGQEDATFNRMSQFIAASVPDFQLPPRSEERTMADRQ